MKGVETVLKSTKGLGRVDNVMDISAESELGMLSFNSILFTSDYALGKGMNLSSPSCGLHTGLFCLKLANSQGEGKL